MGKILLRGFIGVAPIAITITLIVWIYKQLEGVFRAPIMDIIGPKYYFPGLGVIIALVILFLMGLILNNWVVQHFYNAGERLMKKIPLFKTIYTSVSDLMSFFQAGSKKEKGKVVTVEINGLKMLGIVTREAFDDLPNGIGDEGEVVVFFPFSYQIGGFSVLVSKSKVKPVNFSIEQGLRFSITAGSPSADNPTYKPNKPLRKKKK